MRSPRKFSTSLLPLAASLLVLASWGCQSLVFLLAGESGITGRVWGTGCGNINVLQPPPDCEGGPLQTTFSVYDEDYNVVAHVTSEADGTFSVFLVPGTYRIRQATHTTVIVRLGEYTEVVVLIEAG